MSDKQEPLYSEADIEFIETPAAAPAEPAGSKYGVKTTAVSV